MIRAQYHFRPSPDGLLAWDVRRLIELSSDLAVEQVELANIRELDENHWYAYEGQTPTCRSIVGHIMLIDEADLSFPIILDAEGRVMDGMHRVCKALQRNQSHILAVRFSETPGPDYVGKGPDELPYAG